MRTRSVGWRGGFTLIEVLGALVIFSVGTLMVMQVGNALTTQTRYAAARSQIAVLANERVDSLGTLAFASIVTGSDQDTLTVFGWRYERSTTVTAVTPVLKRIDVSFQPLDGLGPSHTVTSYSADRW